MEITEFLHQNEVEIKSSAKELTKMLQAFSAADGWSFEKSFKKLNVTRSGEKMTAKSFENFIKDKEADIKSIDPNEVSDLSTALGWVIKKVIENKQDYIAKKKDERIENTKVPDYYLNGKPIDIEVEIFQTVNKEPNEHDKDLYKCFCKAGEHIVFVSQEATKLITQNNDGSLALGNDMTSMKEGALWSCICKAMKNEFDVFKNKLMQELAMIDNDDLDIEKNGNIVENIFLTKVPCSFSHIVNVVKRYKKGDDGGTFFDGFRVKPNKKMIDSFDFDSFISALAKNFQKMTRGALKEQDEYKAFSNRLDEAAVTHWILPSEETWKKAELPTIWKKFFAKKAEGRILSRVFWYIGAMQDAKNEAEQALVISDGGGTGKSTLMKVLKDLFPRDFFGYINNSTLNDGKEFALSERKVYEHHCLVLDEYDGKSINTPTFKNLIGTKTPVSMSVKNRQAIEHNFTGTKMIVLSNERSVLETHAFRRRVIPVSFSINHKGKDAWSSEQIKEMIDTGKEFLNFCYKCYKTCKCMKANGDYYVLSPEQEEQFLKGEELDKDEKIISTKAISNDDAVSEYFDVHDYEDSDLNLDMKNFINKMFEAGCDEDIISVKDLLKVFKLKLNGCDEDRELMTNLFDGSITSLRNADGEYERIINVHGKSWYIFKEVMRSMGYVNKKIRRNSEELKAWVNIKLKKQAEKPKESDPSDLRGVHMTKDQIMEFVNKNASVRRFTKTEDDSTIDEIFKEADAEPAN